MDIDGNPEQLIRDLEQENRTLRNRANKITHSNLVYRCLVNLNKLTSEKRDLLLSAEKICGSIVDSGAYLHAAITFLNSNNKVENTVSTGSINTDPAFKSEFDSILGDDCRRSAIENIGVSSLEIFPDKTSAGRTVLTARIYHGKRIYGFLTVVVPEDISIDSEETKLFQQVSDELGSAFFAIEREKDNRWFKYMLKKMPNYFAFISTDFRYLVVNERYSEILNTPAAELVGQRVSDFIDEKDYQERVLPMFEQCLSGEYVEYNQVVETGKTGTHQLRIFNYPYIGEDGSVQGILSHGIDITEKRSSEKDLFMFFRRISDEAQYGIAVSDLSGKLEYINKYFADICGYPPDELLGEEVRKLYPGTENDEVETMVAELIENGFSIPREMIYRRKDGTEAPLLIRGIMLYDDFNKPVQMMALAQDLSSLKKTENRLNRSEMRFRHLIDTASDTIIILTGDGIISEINSLACESLGFEREELIGKTIDTLDPNYPVKEFKDFWDAVPYDMPTTFESSHRCKTGRIIPVEIRARKLLIDNETLVISIARDITERDIVKKRMVEAVRKAEESDRLKSAFLANMSHEIRTPLNGILGFSSLMNTPGITPEKQQEYYDIIQLSGQRLLATINDLIDISRIESGSIEIDISSIEINSLLDELYSFFSPEIEAKGIEFILNKSINGELYIRTDYDKLFAILSNLLKNAIKFTNAGSISIGYKHDGEAVLFRVSDTGVGIAEEKLGTIFNRFVQADQSLTKPFEGSGLGLSICREYAEILKGAISVESKEGAGTTFIVTIPVSGDFIGS